ncbi:MAG: rhodanese-like domain-containing protein, partial [Dehalococcoidia bacterium]
ATWCGTVLRRDVPIVLIAEPGREHEAAVRLGRIGYDHVVGFLEGGMQVLEPRTELVRRTDRVTAATLAEQLDTPQPPVILDVRTPGERQQKAIAGSLHIPLNHLSERTAEVPRDRRVVVHCATGYRSSIAASVLERKGFMEISDLVGGISAWEASHLPTATDQA